MDPAAPRLVSSAARAGELERCLVWEFGAPRFAVSSAVLGGGWCRVSWVLNLTVAPDYSRTDPDTHLAAVARGVGLSGPGVGLMTAVDVATMTTHTSGGVRVDATVGVRRPVWAASRSIGDESSGAPAGREGAPPQARPGTINLVAQLPVALEDAALVNAVGTMTEAKVQALLDTGVPGTGTASDAVCLLCPTTGHREPFGGPRSVWGERLADAVYGAVVDGVRRQREVPE